MVEVQIRDARPGDLPALAAVYRRASLSNAGDRENLLANPELLELSSAALEPGQTRVAVSGGEIVGFARTTADGTVVELEDLFVDPDWMRHGFGLALMRDIAATAQSLGRERLEVTANEHARAFYTQAGFVDEGIAETRFGPAPRMALDLRA